MAVACSQDLQLDLEDKMGFWLVTLSYSRDYLGFFTFICFRGDISLLMGNDSGCYIGNK